MAATAIRTGAEGTLAVVLRSIDHIGVAVEDLDAAIAVHRDTYGMPLDVARVISIDEPNSLTCETIQAKMTYVDSQGEEKSVTYLKESSACANS